MRVPEPHSSPCEDLVIVCHCRVVSDRHVRAAIDAGAADLCDVAAACGAGTGCGGCLPEVRRLLADRGCAAEHHVTPQDLRRRLEEVLGASVRQPATA